jgi:CubicO group peptidase (beta-lactamase class C family)
MVGRIGLVCVLVAIPLGLAARSATILGAQGSSLTRNEINRIDAIFAATNRIDGPGCALGITRDGATILERAYGRSNIEDGTAITTDSIFEIGSMTKQFTAMAVTLLADDGRLSMNEDVRKFIPEMPVYERPITLRGLLHHTSGLRELSQLFAFAGWSQMP